MRSRVARSSLLLVLAPALGGVLACAAVGCDQAQETTSHPDGGANLVDAGTDGDAPDADTPDAHPDADAAPDAGADAGPDAGDADAGPGDGSFLFDFSKPAASYPGLTSTLTGSIYLRSGASAAIASTGAADPCYEDHGGPEGGGVWVFPTETNEAPSPIDFAATGWSTFGLTITGGAVTSPDGATKAQKLGDALGTVIATSYAYTSTNAARTDTVWYHDVPGDVPTVRPTVLRQSVAGAPGLPPASAWTRASIYFPPGVPQNTIGLAPAGANLDKTGTGSIYAWGYQAMPGANDIPLITSGTASLVKQLDATQAALVDAGGDLDVDVGFMVSTPDWAHEGDFYLLSAATPEGPIALRWDATVEQWILTVRGVDVLATGASGIGTPNTAAQFSEGAQVYRVRAWYRPSTGDSGLRTAVQGSVSREAGGITMGQALSPVTSVYLGSNLGASAAGFAGRIRDVRRSAAAPGVAPVEVVFFGDSIVASNTQASRALTSVSSYVYTPDEALTRPGVGCLARSGDKVAQQLAAWMASPWRTAAGVKGVVIQVGINDVRDYADAPGLITALQGLVNQVKADQPGAKLVLGQMLPAKSYLALTSPGGYAVWQTVNVAIAGHGATPITGPDAVVLGGDVGSPFNDGAGNLTPAFDIGDGLHTNNLGRAANGHGPTTSFRVALQALGLL